MNYVLIYQISNKAVLAKIVGDAESAAEEALSAAKSNTFSLNHIMCDIKFSSKILHILWLVKKMKI